MKLYYVSLTFHYTEKKTYEKFRGLGARPPFKSASARIWLVHFESESPYSNEKWRLDVNVQREIIYTEKNVR